MAISNCENCRLLLLCHTQKKKIKVKYNDQTIEQVHQAKLLDIHIDSNLIQKDKYNYICKEISEKILVLKYIRDYMKFDILRMFLILLYYPTWTMHLYSLGQMSRYG